MLNDLQGFVYYEGDCFAGLRNPYIPLDVENPSLAQIRQKELVGEGIEERRELGRNIHSLFMKIMNEGLEVKFDDSEDARQMKKYYQLLCEDIKKERRRIGGDWAVASALVLDGDWRAYVRYYQANIIFLYCQQ